MFNIFVKLFLTVFIAAVLTPIVRRIAIKVGAVDDPNARRVNKIPIPTIGGLAIFIAFTFSTFVLLREQFPTPILYSIFLGEAIIIITGLLDDMIELSPWQKLTGMLLAALVIYYVAQIRILTISLPWIGKINLGIWGLPLTILWILAITNAINLIDGLDGLATGVSLIALLTMGLIAYFFLNVDNIDVPIMIFALVASLIGFLPYNFHPASIFLGDTGSLFIGFMISVLSLQGLKNATVISVVMPVLVLGVPITDTFYAIIRRLLNHRPIMEADKHHLHHRLMQMGLTHRQTVIAIYGIALIFSLIALLLPLSSFWGSIALTVAVLISLEIFVEEIGLIGPKRQPLLNLIRYIIHNK
ncbi:undecaprenyl-phosphate alpha-N-acetylglucosaminyl 1-phosphate transferase [Loigolactobacillus backii]|uniref:glycosyltransferase family 4 protein n=1 Tax=Loigolactobacillus backii TaxID=375175 RepID=UPI000C1C8B82|nr:MraY family glycosyltransferase [Loigolactobacillus backii]PIO83908.1 undecaprenyl-phosphate alpha-N-acetylglucosaminyl 1-phosphate transferase [Loigolactobacillus backii]